MNSVDFLLNNYIPFDDLERTDIEKFREFVSKYGEKIYDRFNRTPDQPVITASAVVVNPYFSKVLLTHHKEHKFYKQFGGHAEGNNNLVNVACDELLDESGVTGKLLFSTPIDIIRWNFPKSEKDGDAHDDFDIAFLFMIEESANIKPNKKEVLDTKWETLEVWRDYNPKNNKVYIANPQNIIYQQRIFKKIKHYQEFLQKLKQR